jgi:hypothetical protein
MTNEMISISPGIVNFPYLCSNIPISPAYVVYISQLIRYVIACSTYDEVLNQGSLLTNKLMLRGFLQSCLLAAFCISYGPYNDSIQPSFRSNTVWCVSYQSLSCSWYTDLDYDSYRFRAHGGCEQSWGVEVGGGGVLTPPRHLIPPQIYPEIRVCPILKFVFPTEHEIDEMF